MDSCRKCVEKTYHKCVGALRTILKYCCVTLCCLFLLYFLHWNFSGRSVWDRAFEFTCGTQSTPHSIVICALIYGFTENALLFILLFLLYRSIYLYHWKHRYESDITELLNKMIENSKQTKTEREQNQQTQPITKRTRNMGYKIDPLIITFPWLISPIIKWHSLTNFLIHFSYFLTFSLKVFDFLPTSESNIIPVAIGEYELFELNFPPLKNPEELNLDRNDEFVLHYSVFRTFWFLLLWTLFDHILWKESKGLTYLFETGINNVMQQYTNEHLNMLKQLLLPNVQFIDGLSDIVLSFHGKQPLEQFIIIKVKVYECLKYFNLKLLFNGLTVFTVMGCSLRIYYNPVMVNLISPICYIIGIAGFLLLVLILIFNGIDVIHLLKDFEGILEYSTPIGVVILNIIWGIVVWKNMTNKRKSLLAQQARSLVKDFLKRVFNQNESLKKTCLGKVQKLME